MWFAVAYLPRVLMQFYMTRRNTKVQNYSDNGTLGACHGCGIQVGHALRAARFAYQRRGTEYDSCEDTVI